MRPLNTQILIENLWVPLMFGAGLFVMTVGLWKSLSPGGKLARREYQFLLLFSGFMTLFFYSSNFYMNYAAWLWDFSIMGFIAVVLILATALAGLIAAALRLRTPGPASVALNRPIVHPSPGLRRWQITVIAWGSICILGTIAAILKNWMK